MDTIDVIKTDTSLSFWLQKCCLSYINKDKYFTKDGRLVDSKIWNLPDVADFLIKDNEANKAVVKNILEMIRNYEQSYSMSGFAACHMVVNKRFSIDSRKQRSNFSTINKLVEKNLGCNTTKQIFSYIQKYGNPQMSISVNRQPVSKPVIKFKNNPSIRMRLPGGFNLEKSEFSNCSFFMVDGAISKPSEIMQLLNSSFENKEANYFLVCKSFNEEVLFTLQENYSRSITNVIPLEYGFDLESINSLPDLVSVVGGQPCSPSLGDVVSATSLDRMGSSNKAKLIGNFITLDNAGNQNMFHIRNLIKTIENSNDEKRKLLAKRLISLRGNSCVISLPKSSEYNEVEINVRHTAKIIKDMSSNGVIEMKSNGKKFYLPSYTNTILEDLQSKIENLLSTKIVLSRRK